MPSATALRAIQLHGKMPDLTGESMSAVHHLAVAHNGSADADVGGNVDERAVRPHHALVMDLRGIAGKMRGCSHVRLISGNHIESLDHVVLHEVYVLPTEVARDNQVRIFGDQSG